MGKHARMALILTATSCLVAVTIDWALQEV